MDGSAQLVIDDVVVVDDDAIVVGGEFEMFRCNG